MQMDAKATERARRLADAPRTHRELAKDARASRDQAIFQDAEGGATLGELARAYGLSSSHVHRIVVEQAAARQVVHVE